MAMASSFDWKTQLNLPDFQAASVKDFKHAPFSGVWDNVKVGTEVEVENTWTDIPAGSQQIVFWVASVIKIQGYYCLLRYEGVGDDHRQDFWKHLCSHDVHPVGWSAENGKALIPPQSIVSNFPDLRDFLISCLSGKQTLSLDFQEKVNISQASLFKVGQQYEVVDRDQPSQLKLATLRKVVGQRLYLEYFDSTEDGGIWIHENSSLIHRMGWAKTIGHEIVAPLFYNPSEFVTDWKDEEIDIQVGMKLEVIRPSNPCVIGFATIMKVLRYGYFMVQMEGNGMESRQKGNDWFCQHITSSDIFPCGFCEKNGISLTPPNQLEDNFRAAPVKLKEEFTHRHKIGMKVEASNLMESKFIFPATITRIVGRLLKVHFDGWEEKYDQWLDYESPNIYPIGLCELENDKLETSSPPQEPLIPAEKESVEAVNSGADRLTQDIALVPPEPTHAVEKLAPPVAPVKTPESIPMKTSAAVKPSVPEDLDTT